jgi:hypothetical protein
MMRYPLRRVQASPINRRFFTGIRCQVRFRRWIEHLHA